MARSKALSMAMETGAVFVACITRSHLLSPARSRSSVPRISTALSASVSVAVLKHHLRPYTGFIGHMTSRHERWHSIGTDDERQVYRFRGSQLPGHCLTSESADRSDMRHRYRFEPAKTLYGVKARMTKTIPSAQKIGIPPFVFHNNPGLHIRRPMRSLSCHLTIPRHENDHFTRTATRMHVFTWVT